MTINVLLLNVIAVSKYKLTLLLLFCANYCPPKNAGNNTYTQRYALRISLNEMERRGGKGRVGFVFMRPRERENL